MKTCKIEVLKMTFKNSNKRTGKKWKKREIFFKKIKRKKFQKRQNKLESKKKKKKTYYNEKKPYLKKNEVYLFFQTSNVRKFKEIFLFSL